jgi:hypothetical protein
MNKAKTLQQKAIIALKEAVGEVVAHHKVTGRPLAIWQNGKVKMISASRLLKKRKRVGVFVRIA